MSGLALGVGGGVSRRGFLTGALAVPGAASLAQPARAAAPPQAEQKLVRRGRAIAVHGKRIVVAHAQRRTIAVGRTLINVGGEPLELAISPDGRLAAVTTAGWDEPGLAIVDLARKEVRKRLALAAPSGVAFTRDGRRIVVAGGEQEGRAYVIDAKTLKVIARPQIGLVPRAVASGRDGTWITLNGDDRVVLVTKGIKRELKTPPHPDRLAVSPDGDRLLITHSGLESRRVSEIEITTKRIRRHDVGRLPSAVAYTRTGRRLVATGDEVVIIGGRRRKVGGAPRGLAVAGRRAYTVDALTGAVHEVRAR